MSMIKRLLQLFRDPYRIMEKSTNERYFPIYLKEVRGDIRLMKYFLDYPKFERDREPIFQMMLKKYKANYCPSKLYDYFSDENELEYLYLRTEIDNIIEKSESEFSDFLNF